MDSAAGPSWRSEAPTTGPSSSSTSRSGVTVRIVEQPSKKSPKFRYESENRIPEPIAGASSTEDRRTYPAIEITNYTGNAIIIVSCVTKDGPYRPHPHKVAGPGNNFYDGLCVMTVDITPENRVITFSNIGIVCVSKNGIAASLSLREYRNIDPFHTGFDHGTSTRDIDLDAVRLCFQVYLLRTEGRPDERCPPIISDVINKHNIKIVDYSCNYGSARGGKKVVLICKKMPPGDVVVTLHTEEGAGGEAAWSAAVPTEIVTIYYRTAVVFYTPPYKDPAIRSPITAYIRLQSCSTGETSNSVLFTYMPSRDPGPDYIKEKRNKPLSKELIETLRNVPPVRMDTSPMPVPHETSDQQSNQNTPSTFHTDYKQEIPWPAPVENYASPQDMPKMAFTSANNPFVSTDMLPQSRVTASSRQVTLPQRQVMLPQHNLTSPQDQITLPESQVNLPQRQVMSPQDHRASLQGQLLPDQMKYLCFTLDHMPHESLTVVQQSLEQHSNQNTPSTSHTDYIQEIPWPAPVENHASPLDMPDMSFSSPNNPFVSPDMLPQSRVTAHPRQVTLAQSQITLPQNNLTSPQDQMTLPQGQVNLPQRQVMSPQDHRASLQGQSLPDQMQSLHFTSHPMPHESANVVQQSLEQPMETNSGSSIDRLSTSGHWDMSSGEVVAEIEALGSTENLKNVM